MKLNQIAVRTLIAAVSAAALGYGHVTLTAPAGGENLKPGDTFTVKWTADDHDCVYNLYFSPDSGKNWNNIVLGLPKGDRTYAWTVPTAATALGMVRVFQDNVTGSDLEGKSKVFKIQAGSGIGDLSLLNGDVTMGFQSGNLEVAFNLARDADVALQGYDAQGKWAVSLMEGRRAAGIYRLSFFTPSLRNSSAILFRLRIGNQVRIFTSAEAD